MFLDSSKIKVFRLSLVRMWLNKDRWGRVGRLSHLITLMTLTLYQCHIHTEKSACASLTLKLWICAINHQKALEGNRGRMYCPRYSHSHHSHIQRRHRAFRTVAHPHYYYWHHAACCISTHNLTECCKACKHMLTHMYKQNIDKKKSLLLSVLVHCAYTLILYHYSTEVSQTMSKQWPSQLDLIHSQ